MNATVYDSLPLGYKRARSMFDFVDMHLYEGDGYTLREEHYFIASPDGVFHAFTPSVALTYGDIEKYVKNGQVYVKNR